MGPFDDVWVLLAFLLLIVGLLAALYMIRGDRIAPGVIAAPEFDRGVPARFSIGWRTSTGHYRLERRMFVAWVPRVGDYCEVLPDWSCLTVKSVTMTHDGAIFIELDGIPMADTDREDWAALAEYGWEWTVGGS